MVRIGGALKIFSLLRTEFRPTDLPEPLTDLQVVVLFLSSDYRILTLFHSRFDPLTSQPQLSEAQILFYAKYLSEDIGYRTVGTYEHALADKWMVEQAELVKHMCEDVVRKSGGKRKLECEVWRQEGSGSHRCVFPTQSPRKEKSKIGVDST